MPTKHKTKAKANTKSKTPVKSSRTKATTSAKPYLTSTTRLMDGMGINGSKTRRFSPEAALRAWTHWAYAATMMNANATASVPLRLYARRRSNVAKLYETRPVDGYMKAFFNKRTQFSVSPSVWNKAVEYGMEFEEVTEPHPALTLLQKANPWHNGHELSVLRSIDKQVSGNSYLHVVLDPTLGIPSELWRMPPQWTWVCPDPNLFIRGYNYGADLTVQKFFKPDEVIHFKSPNPRDVHYGSGCVEAAWRALGLHEAKREFDTSRADNYARPDYLVSIKDATPDQIKEIVAALKEKFSGTDKAGKPIVVGGDTSVTPLNFEEKEYGTPTRLIEEIAAVWGTPVAMLLSNDPNRANSEAARLGWYRGTIRPACTDDVEKLNEKYLPLFGEAANDLMLCYDQVCFEDRAALAKEQIGLYAGGLIIADEGREMLGYARRNEPASTILRPPSGSTGGAAALVGDMAVNQNQDRQNEDQLNA